MDRETDFETIADTHAKSMADATSETMTDTMDTTTLVQCDDCQTVTPVIVRSTGDLHPLGTGGDCITGTHAFSLRGKTVSPRCGDDGVQNS